MVRTWIRVYVPHFKLKYLAMNIAAYDRRLEAERALILLIGNLGPK